jgi:oxygen-independent coproporphyrinogen-3 oxidase
MIPIAPTSGSADAAGPGATMSLVERYLRPGTLQLGSSPPLSIYVHLPWCLRKCPYCDFNSHEASGGTAALPEARYLDALVADLDASLPLIWGRTVQSVFIGGGTPSLFSPEGIERLLSELRMRLRLNAGAEITLEANPGTFERDRFRAFRAAGVTRLSIGVQSFDDAKLQALGRVHNRAQALAAAEEAASAFDTFNLDLMYALPGQTLAECEEDVRTALALQPPHLSVYHLTIEPNTRFAVQPPPNLPEDDSAFEMLDRITELTGAAGLKRYEVSAYARDGHHCRHNLNYWQFGDYLGIGAGAHSKLSFPHRVVRQVRWREPNTYMDKALAGLAISNDEEVKRKALPFEFILNALRLRDGFELPLFTERTGLPLSSIRAALQQAEQKGLVTQDLERIKPTARGFDFLSDLQKMFL